MAWERQEPHRHAGSGAQKANGEGRDQGRDRGRPASPAASPRARPGHAGHVRRLRPPEQHQGSDVYSLHIAAQCTFETAKLHVRNSEVRTFETAKCARSKQRSAHLRLATQVRAQILPHAEGALSCFSETARSKSRSRALSGGPPGAFATWQAAGEKHPSHQPGAWGRSWASRPSCCAVAARALTPIHSGSAPPPPCAGLWRVFRVKGGSRGWCGPAAP